METAGLGIGVASLAGLFGNVVDSYGYVRLGRTFARDFETSQARLDISRLRLSRWGSALGLNAAIDETTHLPPALGTAEDVKQAEQVLGFILNSLEDAHAQSQRFASREVSDGATPLNPDESNVHQRVHRLIERRQRNTPFKDKAAWALYKKRELDGLVDDISDFTTQLVTLFPASIPRQQQLSADEARMLDGAGLDVARQVVGADVQDTIFAEAVEKEMQARGHTYNKPHARDGALSHNGDHISDGYQGATGGLSHTYNDPLAEGKGTRQHNGNVYGGKNL